MMRANQHPVFASKNIETIKRKIIESGAYLPDELSNHQLMFIGSDNLKLIKKEHVPDFDMRITDEIVR